MLPGTATGGAGGPGGIGDLIVNGITNIVTTVGMLAASGATHFLVPNMPDLGATPSGSGDAALTFLSKTFNDNLAVQLTALDNALSSIDIAQFDTFATLNKMIADPVAYGFDERNRRLRRQPPHGRCNPDKWLFWDGVHPTTAAAALLAGQIPRGRGPRTRHLRAHDPRPHGHRLRRSSAAGARLTSRPAAGKRPPAPVNATPTLPRPAPEANTGTALWHHCELALPPLTAVAVGLLGAQDGGRAYAGVFSSVVVTGQPLCTCPDYEHVTRR